MGAYDDPTQRRELRLGVWAAIASYGMWGLFPLYWKQITDINAIHILCHRVLWSAIFLVIVLWARGGVRGQGRRVRDDESGSGAANDAFHAADTAPQAFQAADTASQAFQSGAAIPRSTAGIRGDRSKEARWLTRELMPIFRQKKSLIAVIACGALITANWGIYIWAVNSEKVSEASLGYYITPLLSVALGCMFFKEKMDKWTAAALVIAALGVAIAAVMIGNPPWAAISLALTFSIYGAIKKSANLDALPGLALETLIVAPFALAWLRFAQESATCGFFGPDIKTAAFLIVSGPITAMPLLTFAFAAVRIPLRQIGFIQYFSPTIQLLIGLVVFGEKLSLPMAIAFAAVVAAVAVYLGSRSSTQAQGRNLQ